MQRPNADSVYYDDFLQLQEKLQKRIVSLRKNGHLVQEDMADYELSLRQYQRMEQDPKAIVSLWQLFKIAKAHGLDIDGCPLTVCLNQVCGLHNTVLSGVTTTKKK